MSGSLLALAAAVAAAVLYGVGSVAEAVGARRSSAPRALVTSVPYLAGLGCDGAAWLLSLAALTRLPLFVVQPVLTASLAVTAVGAAIVFRTRLRRSVVVWIGVLIVALVALVAGAGTESQAVAGATTRVLLAVGAVLVAAALVLFRNRGPALLAVTAGLAFSGAAVAARVLGGGTLGGGFGALVGEPLTYVVVVFGIAGAWGYAAALERGAVTPVTATLWSVEVVVPTAVGVGLLGDTVRPGFWPVFAVALVGVLVATVMLARATGPQAGVAGVSAAETGQRPSAASGEPAGSAVMGGAARRDGPRDSRRARVRIPAPTPRRAPRR